MAGRKGVSISSVSGVADRFRDARVDAGAGEATLRRAGLLEATRGLFGFGRNGAVRCFALAGGPVLSLGSPVGGAEAWLFDLDGVEVDFFEEEGVAGARAALFFFADEPEVVAIGFFDGVVGGFPTCDPLDFVPGSMNLRRSLRGRHMGVKSKICT